MSNNKQWYALYTAKDYEKKVADSLSKKKIEYFCPFNQVADKYSDRKRKASQPLFPGYVFVHVAKDEHGYLKQIKGVLSILHWLKEPAVFDNIEIEMVREFLNVHPSVKPQKTAVDMNENARIRVIRSTLTEQANKIVSTNNRQVELVLPCMGCVLSAEVEPNKMELVTTRFMSQMKTFVKPEDFYLLLEIVH